MNKIRAGSPREQLANGSQWTAYIGAQVIAPKCVGRVGMRVAVRIFLVTRCVIQSQLESNPSTAGFTSFEEYVDDKNEAIKAVIGR